MAVLLIGLHLLPASLWLTWRGRLIGLLYQAGMFFIGLIFVMVLKPFMMDVPFPLMEVSVVLVMGFLCIVPFVLFTCGVVSGKSLKQMEK